MSHQITILFLNIWHSKQENKVNDFLINQAATTDVICLQEAEKFTNSIAQTLLPDFNFFGAKTKFYSDNISQFDQVTLVRKTFKSQSLELFRDNPIMGLGIKTSIETPHGQIDLLNYHGITYHPTDDKMDNLQRIAQSENIISEAKNWTGIKILGGDFNVESKTKSIEMFETSGYVDLIKKFNVKTTRNELAWKNYEKKLLFSDYIFVDPTVKVKSLTLPNIDVSDHLPMILEIDI